MGLFLPEDLLRKVYRNNVEKLLANLRQTDKMALFPGYARLSLNRRRAPATTADLYGGYAIVLLFISFRVDWFWRISSEVVLTFSMKGSNADAQRSTYFVPGRQTEV
jgi:hypothetical protein